MQEAEIIGAAIRAVLDVLVNPQMSLRDFQRAAEALGTESGRYYPLSLYTELTSFLEGKYSATVFRSIGRSVGRAILERSILPRGVSSLPEALSMAQLTHEEFCRPAVGEVRVEEERDGYLLVRYTCPYNCVIMEGLFVEGARRFGSLVVKVRQTRCQRDGAEACLFEVNY